MDVRNAKRLRQGVSSQRKISSLGHAYLRFRLLRPRVTATANAGYWRSTKGDVRKDLAKYFNDSPVVLTESRALAAP